VIELTPHQNSIELAQQIRLTSLEMCYNKRASHIGGAFSIADVLAVMYRECLTLFPDNSTHTDRDRVFYSKGHACTAFYSVLQLTGFFERKLLDSFTDNGSYLTSHINHKIPGVELSTGSLGHALSVACGVAKAGKINNKLWQVYTIVSDGELDEGSNWEAILFAPHHQLSNLTLIVDYNKIQSFGTVAEVLNLEPLADKFLAFGWKVFEVDGHDHNQIREALRISREYKQGPSAIIAHTIKGKGVSFMENQLAWHYKSPTKEQFDQAWAEITGAAK
jgi:transketolase